MILISIKNSFVFILQAAYHTAKPGLLGQQLQQIELEEEKVRERDRQIKKYYFQQFLFLFISIDKNVNKNTNNTNNVSSQATCRKNCLISA